MNNELQSRSGFGVRAYHSRVDSEQFSSQAGWRLPLNLIAEIREAAAGAGGRPGGYVARMLRRGLLEERQAISGAELARPIRLWDLCSTTTGSPLLNPR